MLVSFVSTFKINTEHKSMSQCWRYTDRQNKEKQYFWEDGIYSMCIHHHTCIQGFRLNFHVELHLGRLLPAFVDQTLRPFAGLVRGKINLDQLPSQGTNFQTYEVDTQLYMRERNLDSRMGGYGEEHRVVHLPNKGTWAAPMPWVLWIPPRHLHYRIPPS